MRKIYSIILLGLLILFSITGNAQAAGYTEGSAISNITSTAETEILRKVVGNDIFYSRVDGGNNLVLCKKSLVTEEETILYTIPSGYNLGLYGDTQNWDASGNYVVFANNNDIFLYKIIEAQLIQITNNASSQYLPRVSGDKIVWIDERNRGGGTPSRSDIFSYDIVGAVDNLEINENSGIEAFDRYGLSFDGTSVKYVLANNATQVSYNLNTFERTTPGGNIFLDRLVLSTNDYKSSGNIALLIQFNTGFNQIFVQDIVSGSVVQLTTSASHKNTYLTNGSYAVWEENGDIYKRAIAYDNTAPVVTVNQPDGTTFVNSGTVNVQTNESSDVYYTTDGSVPTTASTKLYGKSDPQTGNVSIIETCTLKILAVDRVNNTDSSYAYAYTVTSAGPLISIDINGGNFNHNVIPQFDTTNGVEITHFYYTLDGTDPTEASTEIFPRPVTFNLNYWGGTETKVLKYFGVGPDGTPGPIYTKIFNFDDVLPVVSVDVTPAMYNSARSVTITADKAGSIIKYTLDGSEPDGASPIYDGSPIEVGLGTTVIKAFAVDPYLNTGWTSTFQYVVDPDAPTVINYVDNAGITDNYSYLWQDKLIYRSRPGGIRDIFMKDLTTDIVTQLTNTPESEYNIQARDDLVVWDATDNIYVFNLNDSSVRQITNDVNYVYSKPFVSGDYVVYLGADTTTWMNKVYYYKYSTEQTFSVPDGGSNQDSPKTDGRFIVYDDWRNGGNDEIFIYDIQTDTETRFIDNSLNTYWGYAFDLYQGQMVYQALGSPNTTINKVDLTNLASDAVLINSTQESNKFNFTGNRLIFMKSDTFDVYVYDLDTGSEKRLTADSNNKDYLSMFGTNAIWANTDAFTGETDIYLVEGLFVPPDVTAPVITATPTGGTYGTTQNVELTADEAATIYYTVDGSAPTEASTVYAGQIEIAANKTLKYFGKDTVGNISNIVTQNYIIDTAAPTISADQVSGTYGTPITVTLSSNEAATIYYTTDGSAPTAASTQYTVPIVINSTTTLKFIGVDVVSNTSGVSTLNIVIDTTAPVISSDTPAGLYNSSKVITLSTGESADIYYTTDGSIPTLASTQYSTPLNISTTTTLKIIARDIIGNTSGVTTLSYTIDTLAPTATISVDSGLYNSSQSVTITPSEAATIYYTLDGTEPTEASTLYTGAISISVNKTLKVLVKDTAGNTVTYTRTYTFDYVSPIISSSLSVNLSTQYVTLTSNEVAVIRYTTDGSEPNGTSQIYGAPVLVNFSTLKYFGTDTAGNNSQVYSMSFGLDLSSPTITPSIPAGNYATPQSLTLSADEAATIYYTTDGSTPTAASTEYTVPIVINSNTTVKYFGVDSVGNTSSVSSASFVIDPGLNDVTDPVVVADIAGGYYNSARVVSLTADETATIYFTTDGSIPTTSSNVFSYGVPINSTTTLKFFGEDNYGNSSAVASVDYVIDTVSPTASAAPNGGTFTTSRNVTLTSIEDGTIYYTIDGSNPTQLSTAYTVPIVVNANTTIKYFAVDLAGNSSAVNTATFVIDPLSDDSTPPVITPSLVGGTYNGSRTVSLTADETATIYFTTDGSNPTTSSNTFGYGIPITANTTLKYFAVDAYGNSSAIQTVNYVIDNTDPVISIDPVGGTYTSGRTVTLSSNEAAAIYYTTDGSTPTVASQVYITPLSINSTTTIKYFGIDAAGNESAVVSVTFVIDPLSDDITPPVITPSIAGGLYIEDLIIGLTANESATIYFTTDGSNPTTSSNIYGYGVLVNSSKTIKYFGVDAYGNSSAMQSVSYTIDKITPAINIVPSGGTYTSSRSVTFTSSETATIYYTTDGSTPTISSNVYSAPIVVSSSTTIKFFGVDLAGNSSAVNTATFVIDPLSDDITPPVITPSLVGGIYNENLTISLTTDEPSTIFFTINGADPTVNSSVYSYAIPIISSTQLKFMGRDNYGNLSEITTVNYILDKAAPIVTISPSGGIFNTAQNISLTSNEAVAIYYTTDGSTPTVSSQVYTTSIPITASKTVKAIAVDSAGNVSSIASSEYTIDAVTSISSILPNSGYFTGSQAITISTSKAGAAVYYSTYGIPVADAVYLYSGQFTVNETTTVNYFSVDLLGNVEEMKSATFAKQEAVVLDTTSPITSINTTVRNFADSITLEFNVNESAITYYGVNKLPTLNSIYRYTGSFVISESSTLIYFSVDTAGNIETMKMAVFIKDPPPVIVTVGGVGGGGGGNYAVPVTVLPPKEEKIELKLIKLEDIPEVKVDIKDIGTSWAKLQIEELSKRGIIKPFNDSFRPTETITREEYVELLVRVLQTSEIDTSNITANLRDIQHSWAKVSIAIAVKFGIVNGYPDGTFKPEDKVTRAEMATMYSRLVDIIGNKKAPSQQVKFKDITPGWADSAISKMVELNVINGYEDGTFKPDRQTTREEIAATLYRILKM